MSCKLLFPFGLHLACKYKRDMFYFVSESFLMFCSFVLSLALKSMGAVSLRELEHKFSILEFENKFVICLSGLLFNHG